MEGGQGGEGRAVLDLDDPKLEEKLVSELKAQGVFDQFRKDCLSDVDTKPAYQNLRVRVDKSVSAYLDRTTWRSTLNKNQLRNQLRKYIQEMSGVEAGVDRIVDQIVNPAAMEAEVESVIYRYFGTTKEVEEAKEQEALANGGGVLMEEEEEEIKPATLNGEVGEQHPEEAEEPSSEVQEEFSQASSPGPDMAAVSPLTPQDSPTVPQGDISPITPKQSPENMEVDSPPRPPSAYTPPPRPTESFTPPPPPTQILGLGKAAAPPQAPILLPPPPPPPAASDSGGEASMSSISDTDLGEVSPPQPRRNIPEVPASVPLPPSPPTPPAPAPPPSATPPPPGEASDSGEGSDLGELERMKAELLAQLEGDFKISPEESESEGEEGEEVKGTEKEAGGGSGRESGGAEGDSPNQLQRMRNLPRPPLSSAAAMSPRSPSASPSPPPPTQRLSLSNSPPCPPRRGPMTPPPFVPPPPEAAMESMTLESSATPTAPSGCQPFSDRGRSSGSSPEDEGGRRRGQEHLSIPLPPLPPPPASTQASSSVAQGPSSGGEGEQKRAVLHSSSSSSTSSTSSSSSTPSSSKHRDRKHDRKHEKAIKEKEKAKIEKYDQKVKSKDKLKSDKFQDLDIFSSSKTKTPVTPYQPHRLPGQSLGKNGTPVKEGEQKKPEEKVVKEKQDFKTPGKVEERRRSSSNSEKGKERRHSSSSSSSHSQSKDRHRHDKERRHSKDEERRHSKDERRLSEKSEEKKLAEEIKRAGDKERERLLRLYSSEGGAEDEKKEKKYEKEREQQALESKKRLQESRERKEKEEKAEKERKRMKEKERRERERRLEKEREAKEEKARRERLEENKNAVKEKIQTLQPDELKMVLLESIVAKEGGNLDETQRKDVLRTLESAIVGKVVEKKKSPGKNGRRSRVRGGDSSDDDFTPVRAKRLPSRRKVDSESDSCSDDSDSDSGIKALKTRIADRRKSTEEMVMQSRKSPDTSTTSSRKSSEDSTASSSKVSEEKPSRKAKSEQLKTTSPKEPVEPLKSKSSPTKSQLSPVKSQKSPATQLPNSPSKLTPKTKLVAAKKQETSGSKSKQGRSKAKVLPEPKVVPVELLDDDPTVEPLEAFKQSDIEFLLHMKDLYGKKLERGIDALSISSVTSSELNLAIPASKTVTIDVEEGEADDLVQSLAGFGGNPRLFTAVPSWLAPHLEASRVKEEVEMPTKQEIANYLVKKNKASKRKAGWDIVVEVVPTGPQPKRSKLEIQLGYDSAFAESLTMSGGRRSRRPNKRYSDGADDSTVSETVTNVGTAIPIHEGKSNLEDATTNSNLEVKATNNPIKIDAEAEVKNTEEEADVSEGKMEVDQSDEIGELNSSQTEQTFSSVETVEIKEEEIERSLESIRSSSEESLKLELVDTSEDTETKVNTSKDTELGVDTSVDTETKVDTSKDMDTKVNTSKDTELEKKVEDFIRKEETVAEVDNVSLTATSPESSFEDSKKETSAKSDTSPKKSATKSKELAGLISESNVNELPNGKVRELRKRKAANPLNSSASNGNSSASNCKGVEEEEFYGWEAPPPPPRTGWKLLGAEEEEDETLEEVGASFGFVKEDVLLPVNDQDQSLMMEVVMSPPMIQDTKRVEREVSSGSTKKVAFPESDQEERGSQSPSSFGSSKENVPEICNTAPLQKGCPNISKRRRSNKNPVLKTNTVV